MPKLTENSAIQKVIVTLSISLLSWFGYTLNELQLAVTDLSATMRAVKEQLADVKHDVQLARGVPDLERRVGAIEVIVFGKTKGE